MKVRVGIGGEVKFWEKKEMTKIWEGGENQQIPLYVCVKLSKNKNILSAQEHIPVFQKAL